MTDRKQLIKRFDTIERQWINDQTDDRSHSEMVGDFAIEVSKEAVDEFLAAVVKEMHKGYFTDRDCTTIHMIFNQVYAERYGNSL